MKTRRIFAWDADTEHTGVVTRAEGADSRLLTPFMDLTRLEQSIVLEQVPGSKPIGDFAFTGGEYPKVLSDRALDVLGSFLRPNGDLTRVSIRGDARAFHAFTPRRVLDVLDEERSTIHPTSYGRYLRQAAFRRYEFNDHDVFVVKGFEDLHVFVTDAFVEAVSDAHLQGADFSPQIMSDD